MNRPVPLLESQITALGRLHERWATDRIVLIGASSLGFFMNMRWRETRDLDLAIAVDIEDVVNLRRELEDWEPDRLHEQRFRTPEGVLVDLIPAAPALLQAGEVTWPSGFSMSLVGMRLAFAEARSVQLSKDRRLLVAPPEVVMLLKVTAYSDRPEQRRHDLADIAHILEDSVSADDAERYSDEAIDRGLEYEESGAFVVGTRLGRIINESEQGVLESFVQEALADDDRATIRQRLVSSGPRAWRSGQDEVVRRLEAFRAGLDDGRRRTELTMTRGTS